MTVATDAPARGVFRHVGPADRWRLLTLFPQAGWPVTVALVVLKVLGAAVPAASAAALAWLVGAVSGERSSGLLTLVMPALVGYAAVLVLSHASEALGAPLQYLVKVRIDGTRRAAIARLVTGHPTIEVLEDSEIRELVRVAKAEPENWTERTPGDGAVAQLDMCASFLGIVASCLVLARFSWWLVPVVVIPASVARILQSRHGVEYMRQWRRGVGEGRRSSVWDIMLSGPAEGKEVRVFGYAELAVTRMRAHLLAMFEPVWAVGERNLRREQWVRFLFVAAGLGVTFAWAALAAAHGVVPVAIEAAVFVAGWAVYQSIADYDARAVLGAIPGEQAYRALRTLLSAHADDPADPQGGTSADRPPHVRFEGVSFTYPGADRAVLDALDLDLRPGELLAVVGLNGAGKSTLIKLLVGLYRPTGGAITADGDDIWRMGIRRWRRRVAVVFQEFARYHLSLERNITLGSPDVAGEPALDSAIDQAGLSPVVEKLPDGTRTPLARSRTGGVDLSGGQWQQVVLARALYATGGDARILVLDEPTAHLDVRSEFEVFDRLARNRGRLSVVLISHRLSTVRQADRIVLLEAGRIVESGSHDELIARQGRYAQMFTMQAQRFARGYDDRLDEEEAAS